MRREASWPIRCLAPRTRQPNISHPCNPLQPATPRRNPPHTSVHNEQVRAARAAGIRVILAHECDPALGGCEFSSLFQATPQDLIDNGLYARIAVAFYTGQHRAVSMCLLARELGAVRDRSSQAMHRIKGALKSRVHTANLPTSAALSFLRNASGTSSRPVQSVVRGQAASSESCNSPHSSQAPGANQDGLAPAGQTAAEHAADMRI